MIKYQGTNSKNNRKTIGFILEERNIERLKNGDPIFVDLALFGVDAELLIEFSHDIRATAREMQRNITPDTLVHDTRDQRQSDA